MPSDALPLLRSLASLYLYRADFDKGLTIGRRLLELAERQQDPALQAEGNLRVGTNLVSLGHIDEGLEHLDRAIGLFDPQRQASGRLRLGPSPGIVPYTTSAFVLWSIGYPARAVERGAGALRVAAELRHPYSAAYALFHVAFLDLWRRDWSSVHERASQVRDIAEEHDYQVWRALALIFLGVSEAALGRPAEGHGPQRSGDRSLPGPDDAAGLLAAAAVGARTRVRHRQPARGRSRTDRPGDRADAGPRQHPVPPAAAGQRRPSRCGVGRDDARGSFRDAFDTADAAGARMWQLRAATRLAELRSASGEPADEERAALRAVYETFAEESDTADLADARLLLGSQRR